MVKKKDQIDALKDHDRVFGVTTVTEVTEEPGFGHGENVLYRIEFYEAQGDAVVPRHCHLVVVDEGKATEEARWFGGEPVQEWQGKDLCGRVMESDLFQSKHGKVLQVRENCIIASVFMDTDSDGVEEEVIVRIYDDEGTLKSTKVRVVTTPPLPQ